MQPKGLVFFNFNFETKGLWDPEQPELKLGGYQSEWPALVISIGP
jgi:hypothetical protein